MFKFLIRFLFLPFLLLLSSNLRAQHEVEVFVADFNKDELRRTMEGNASAILSEFNAAFENDASPEFTDDIVVSSFIAPLTNLWENSPFYIPDNRIIETIARMPSGRYEMRNIPLYLVDPDGEEHYEEAVIQFTPSGMISEFRIGLSSHRYQDLMAKGQDDIDNANRQNILAFIENFRTSYNRKDLDFIKNVFSDQALIIVGRVVENTGERSAYEQQVEYLQFTKDEYIDRLQRLFEINAWIKVGFEEIQILRHPLHKDVYGVSLTQFYSSSIYSDEGYLFLLIDFKDPDKPMIHVRTWQPKQATPEDQVFTIGHMEIF